MTGGAIHVRDITVERNRANQSEQIARHAETAMKASLDELTLRHAEVLLTSDPSAALDSLAEYHGDDSLRAAQLRAEAVGRGVAVLRAVPHTDSILWLRGLPNGSIASLSVDGTITSTAPDGTSMVLAKDVSSTAVFSYAESRQLLAYACDSSNLCLLDFSTGRRIAVPETAPRARLVSLAFSPEGSQLALLSDSGGLRVLDLINWEHPVERFHMKSAKSIDLLFVDRDSIALGSMEGLKLVRIHGDVKTLSDPDGSLWDAMPDSHRLALATEKGQAYLAELDRLNVVQRATLCNGGILAFKAVPARRIVAFGCKTGTVGIWDLQTNAVLHKGRISDHSNMMAIDATGQYVVAAGDGGVARVIDMRTGLTAVYRGQGYRLTALSPPSMICPFILAADVRGGIRSWPLPVQFVSLDADLHDIILSATYSRARNISIIGLHSPVVASYSKATGLAVFSPHAAETPYVESKDGAELFAMYGPRSIVELWSLSPIRRLRTLDTGHGAVTHLAFVPRTDDIITSGRDGRLVRWLSGTESYVLKQFEHSIDTFILTGPAIVLGTDDGNLWRNGAEGDSSRFALLDRPGGRITRILTMPDRVSLCIGFSTGASIVLNTHTWDQIALPRAAEAIRDIAISNNGSVIALAANDNTIRLGHLRTSGSWRTADWLTLSIRARKIALTADGTLLAVSPDGAVWIYSSQHQKWLYMPIGATDLTHIQIDAASAEALVFDAEGRIFSLDINSIEKSW